MSENNSIKTNENISERSAAAGTVVYEYVAKTGTTGPAKARKAIVSVIIVLLLIAAVVLAALLAKQTVDASNALIAEQYRTYSVRFVEPEHGEIKGSGTYTKGKRVTVSAMPYVGYRFDGWYVRVKDDSSSGYAYEKVSSNKKYTFVVEKKTVLKAKFVKEKPASSPTSK